MITNVVCNADLRCAIDLRLLTLSCTEIIYDPRRFAGAVWRHKKIGGTCMIFSNGKMMVNGKVKTIGEAKFRVRRYARCLQKMGFNVTLTRIRISTISAFYTVEYGLDLRKITEHFAGNYHPEIFPALIFVKGGVTFTCFHTGCVVMTGIKKNRHFYDVVIPVLIEMYIL
jgi:transcription initiation factor TFIID TATA-box-binding protein